MALSFYPRPGLVLMCDFSTGFKAPEMVKKRPVVVISPHRKFHKLCTIVPLSTTIPNPVEKYHHCLQPSSLPGKFAQNETWAKCDMIYTVSLDRLDRVLIRDRRGNRSYVSERISNEDFTAIQHAVKAALGL